MSHPYDPDRPAQPQSPPPWESGPAVPPASGEQTYQRGPEGFTPPPLPDRRTTQQNHNGSWSPTQPYGVPPKRSWARRHKVLTGIGAFILIGAIGSAIGGSGGNDSNGDRALVAATPTMPPISSEQAAANSSAAGHMPTADGVDDSPTAAPTTAVPRTAAPTTTQAKPKPAPNPKPPAEPDLTTSQKQAIGSAESYLGFQAFSRKGLIQQLSSSAGEGFSVADATFAVDHITVNWKEQAVRSAKEYLQFEHFSRAGLIQQLSSSAGEGFTRAEATYAADKVGL